MSSNDRFVRSRRTFLKTVGGAIGAAALPMPARAAATPALAGAWDVIVIGGGFAGVTAARELQHAGLRTLLLEARARLGGRTFAARVGDEILELGGTWLHSTQPNAWAEVNRYGLELVEMPEGSPEKIVWWNGTTRRDGGLRELLPLASEALCAPSGSASPPMSLSTLEAFALLSQLMAEFHEAAAEALPRPFDPFFSDAWKALDGRSVKDRLDEMDLSADRRALLEGALGASCHGPFAQCGLVEMLRWWALSGSDLQRYGDSVARYRLREGTSALIDAMIADGKPDVRLQTPVRRVVQAEGHVDVTTEGGETIRARAVVAALPMNLLSRIEWMPALATEKLAASTQRHAGSGIKAYIRVRGEVPRLLAFAGESEPFQTIMTAHTGNSEALFVAFGIDPGKIDVHHAPAVEAALRKFLPQIEVQKVFAYDWHLDPWSLGTWCILRPGQMTKYLAALREHEGLVHFAGADFALGWRGFIDGAIESGNRVAHEVIAKLAGRAAKPVALAVSGSVARDDSAFAPCAVCHPRDPSAKSGVGPNLHGVVGRPTASTDFAYSRALRERGGSWSEAQLDAFLADPQAFAPGTTMPFAGLKDPADRAAVIRLLRETK